MHHLKHIPPAFCWHWDVFCVNIKMQIRIWAWMLSCLAGVASTKELLSSAGPSHSSHFVPCTGKCPGTQPCAQRCRCFLIAPCTWFQNTNAKECSQVQVPQGFHLKTAPCMPLFPICRAKPTSCWEAQLTTIFIEINKIWKWSSRLQPGKWTQGSVKWQAWFRWAALGHRMGGVGAGVVTITSGREHHTHSSPAPGHRN